VSVNGAAVALMNSGRLFIWGALNTCGPHVRILESPILEKAAPPIATVAASIVNKAKQDAREDTDSTSSGADSLDSTDARPAVKNNTTTNGLSSSVLGIEIDPVDPYKVNVTLVVTGLHMQASGNRIAVLLYINACCLLDGLIGTVACLVKPYADGRARVNVWCNLRYSLVWKQHHVCSFCRLRGRLFRCKCAHRLLHVLFVPHIDTIAFQYQPR
jgi:hypothetical protein